MTAGTNAATGYFPNGAYPGNGMYSHEIAQAQQMGLASTNTITPLKQIAEVGGRVTGESPDGSVQGAIAIPTGAPVPQEMSFDISTVGADSGSKTTIQLFDTGKWNSGKCGCAPQNLGGEIAMEGCEDTYDLFLASLCSEKYFVYAAQIIMAYEDCETSQCKMMKAMNMPINIYQGNFQIGRSHVYRMNPIRHVHSMQNVMGMATMPLMGRAQRIDRNTMWEIGNVPAGMEITLTLFVYLRQ